jgi:hypothetical protein
MDIVQLIYRPIEPQGALKDFEFSRSTMVARWQQGILRCSQHLARLAVARANATGHRRARLRRDPRHSRRRSQAGELMVPQL